ncbi:MAG: alpha-amylase, partial [Bacteroidota bacterium]|nr:alpha-amylase [Bacteroidota bacterium]MDX5429896.1 alpha-amylase [Bacteroidota bacterium]MDX5468670.1 alpha-amylase [Bacteroidota bacterium]
MYSTATAQVAHVPGVESGAIYEVNIRQYTPEGTIQAFLPHLKRLKSMGVDMLWIMPIQPIGVKNRKGELGSYYSISDYTAVNPEFGTLGDVKELVEESHRLGMRVILDWVANHSAWDNVWVKEHKDWFVLDSTGNFTVPYDWTDVIKLNYENQGLRNAMLEAMKFWVKETGMDGFRCDVAYEVPMDFWNHARMELDRIKPV